VGKARTRKAPATIAARVFAKKPEHGGAGDAPEEPLTEEAQGEEEPRAASRTARAALPMSPMAPRRRPRPLRHPAVVVARRSFQKSQMPRAATTGELQRPGK